MKIFKIIGLLFTVVVLTAACSKSDDDDVNEENSGNGGESKNINRNWKNFQESGLSLEFNFFGNDSRPDWQSPSPYDFESFMILKATLPFELRSTARADDMIAVYIKDELRAVASPSVKEFNDDDNYTYILKVLGNDERSIRQHFTYKYYSSYYNRIFEESDLGHFMAENVIGVDSEFVLTGLWENLNDIYPVQSFIELTLPDDIEPEKDEFVTAFVGNELRGLARATPSDQTVLLQVFGKEEGEQATICYLRFAHYVELEPTIKIESGQHAVLLR